MPEAASTALDHDPQHADGPHGRAVRVIFRTGMCLRRLPAG